VFENKYGLLGTQGLDFINLCGSGEFVPVHLCFSLLL
jgi:hypothetical protein